jgi:hypothetical protein
VRSTAAPYTESRLTRSVANKSVGFPVVEHLCINCSAVSTTPAKNLSPVSLTPAINLCHGFSVIAGVIDTGEQFIAGDNDSRR